MHVWLLPTVTLNAVPTEPEEDLGSAEIDEASQWKKLKNWRARPKGTLHRALFQLWIVAEPPPNRDRCERPIEFSLRAMGC
jgi:hypothetical protein